jgi:hypothetical protein
MNLGMPGLTSAAIIAALGYTPASAGAVVMADGTAAAPGMFFGSTTDLGFYLAGADVMGVAVEGLQHTRFYNQNVLGTDDGAVIHIGRDQTIVDAAEAYPVTLRAPAISLTGDEAAVICANIFGGVVTSTDTVTKINLQAGLEIDKLDLQAAAGAVIFSRAAGVRVRAPVPYSNVTVSDSYAITFTPPVPDGTGATTRYAAIHFPASNAYATTAYGLLFAEDPSGGAISSASGVDVSIKPAADFHLTAGEHVNLTAGSGSAYHMTLNAPNASGQVRLQTQGNTMLTIGTIGATAISNGVGVRLDINNTPSLYTTSTSGSAALAISSKTADIDLYTGGSQTTRQVKIANVTSAVNYIDLRGAVSGANPRIGASAENLILGTGAALATGATAGFMMIPGVSGTPTGAPTGAGTGAVALVADTTNHKLYFYSGGSWRDAGP